MNIDVKLETRLFDDDYGFSDLLEKYNGKLTDDAKKEIKELIEEDIMYMIEQCSWTFSEASERESTTEVSKKNESKSLNIADVSKRFSFEQQKACKYVIEELFSVLRGEYGIKIDEQIINNAFDYIDESVFS